MLCSLKIASNVHRAINFIVTESAAMQGGFPYSRWKVGPPINASADRNRQSNLMKVLTSGLRVTMEGNSTWRRLHFLDAADTSFAP